MKKTRVELTTDESARAALLSLFCPGLGHAYNGQMGLGLLLGPGCLLAFAVLTKFLGLGYMAWPYLIAIGVLWYIGMSAHSWHVGARNRKAGFKLRFPIYLIAAFCLGMAPVQQLAKKIFPIQYFDVPSTSMLPTIRNEGRVIGDKTVFTKTDPARGDLVIFRHPHDEKVLYVKRLIGLPGDKIEVRDHILYVNGKDIRVESPVDPALMPPSSASEKPVTEAIDGNRYVIWSDPKNELTAVFAPVTVPENQYFLLGDNRDRSNDSRFIGFVSRASLHARVEKILN